MKCPEVLVSQDSTILENIFGCYEESRLNAELTMQKLNILVTTFKNQKEHLNSELNKAKAYKALSEMMKSSDPAPIFDLIKIKDLGKKELEINLKRLYESLDQKEKELIEGDFERKLGRDTDPLLNQDILNLPKEKAEKTKKEIIEKSSTLPILKNFSKESTALFSEKKLSTATGVNEAREWLRTQMLKYSESSKALPFKQSVSASINESLKLSAKLSIVINTLVNGVERLSKTEQGFPFDKLDDLLYDSVGGFHYLHWTKGFNTFLAQLEDSYQINNSYHTVKLWDGHRDSQTPNNDKIKEDFDSLFQVLNKKLDETQIAIQEKEIILEYRDKEKALSELAESLTTLSNLNNDIKAFEEHRKTLATQEEELLLDIKKLQENFEQEKLVLADLNSSIDILKCIANLLVQNQELSQLIAKIESEMPSTVLLPDDKQNLLQEMLVAARKDLIGISSSIPFLENKIGQLKDNIYKENISKVKAILEENDLKIASFEQTICKIRLDDILLSIAKENKKLIIINNVISSQIEKPYRFNLLAELLNNYIDLSVETANTLQKINCLKKDLQAFNKRGFLQETNKEAAQLCDKLIELELVLLSEVHAFLNVEFPKGSIKNLAVFPMKQLQGLAQLLVKIDSTSNDALVKIDSIIGGFVEEANEIVAQLSAKITDYQLKIANLILTEERLKQQENETLLDEISDFVAKFPSTQLNQISALLELKKQKPTSALLNFQILNENFENLILDSETNRKQNLALKQAINTRVGLVNKFQNELSNYLQERQTRYPTKDFFFKADLEWRNATVNELSQHLNNYAESGNSKPLMDYLKGKTFPGVNLQPIINRLKIDIKNHEAPVNVIADHQNNYFRAAEILRLFKKIPKHTAFVNRVRGLYSKIDLINIFANSLEEGDQDQIEARTLATLLLKQVHVFVIDYANDDENRQKLLEDFKSDFDCLLHSQDNVLSKHYSWPTVIYNVGLALLALCTLGASLVFTLLCRDSVFFKPDAIEYINKVDEQLEEVTSPPVA